MERRENKQKKMNLSNFSNSLDSKEEKEDNGWKNLFPHSLISLQIFISNLEGHVRNVTNNY